MSRLATALIFAIILATAGCAPPLQMITIPAAIPAAVAPAAAASPPAPERVMFTGLAVLQVEPDLADLHMTLSAEAARPVLAAGAVQGQQRKLVEALGVLGVTGGDLRLSALRLVPLYDERIRRRVVGYRAEVSVTVTSRDFARIGLLMEAGADAGVTDMSSSFRRSDLPAKKKEVRDLALAAARAKAAQTAAALGITLGPIVSVSEGADPWGRYQETLANNVRVQASADVAPLGGELTQVTLEVTVVYELARAI